MRVAAARAAGEADEPPRDATPEPDAGELDLSGQAAWLRVLAGTAGVATRAVGRDGFAVRSGLASNTENGVVCRDVGGDDAADVVAWLDVPVRELADAAQLDGFVAAMPAAGLLDDDDVAARADLLARVGLGAGAPLRHLMAQDRGRVDGILTLLLEPPAAVVLHLGVAPGRRGAGLGRALARAARAVALEAGCRDVVAAPSPDALAWLGGLGLRVAGQPPDRAWYLPSREA